MKTSNLLQEAEHQIYFGKFISELSQKFNPLQIFCFSKNISQTSTNGCFIATDEYLTGDYCLLLVMDTVTRVDYEVQDFANIYFKQSTVTVICHSNQSVWEAIDANSRFFKSIYNQGELLFSFDGLLNSPVSPYVPGNGASKARKHLQHRIPLAEGFFAGAAECFSKEKYGISTFMLHQVIEQSLIVLIRVHVAYRSEFHNLHRLIRLCLCFSDKPFSLFLGTNDNKRLFDVLSKSYSFARYKDDFQVTKIDAELLLHKAEKFLQMVKSMCEEKIVLLQLEVDLSAAQLNKSEPLIKVN